MHYDFDLKIDKVASSAKPNFSRAEKDWLLNEAQNVIIKQRYGLTNPHRTGFEGTQKRIDDLKELHIKYPLQPALNPSVLDSETLELRLDALEYTYWFLTRAEIEIIEEACVKRASLKPIQNDDINYARKDPFNKSFREEVLYNTGKASNGLGSSLYIYPDGLATGQVYVEYVKQPARMSFGGYVYLDGVTYPQQDCELSDHLHSELVDMAVQIAAGIIENPNFVQLKSNKVLTQE